jgi:hypothetical protein
MGPHQRTSRSPAVSANPTVTAEDPSLILIRSTGRRRKRLNGPCRLGASHARGGANVVTKRMRLIKFTISLS